jgi:hypothetical protein
VGPAPPARNFHRFRTQFWPGAGECSHVRTPSLTPSHEDVGAPWRTEATTTSRPRNPPGRQRSAMNIVRATLKTAGPAKGPGVRIPLPPPIGPLGTTI